ncbi:uncharacterized protein AMSG_06860 [Thecamonas trahens ATCC 50062]|uniref:Uncharacterized protein n=1 Tax=Thecamonas trahens ATCC 50062 TaxID=461836 RepID=A0A0L0DGA3_THETB|nr:hypothetical protein AMSG_06860 [Thecamonas trahens ATCC 50062]KNC50373.1 hypothetical protein AMSG_06860 [Thecamonas trahens ATCC 50062]|eukprot:XP_013756915.1 hypothetical protein AMSG_06860 [Thecamonas trahens ATCC 50062]
MIAADVPWLSAPAAASEAGGEQPVAEKDTAGSGALETIYRGPLGRPIRAVKVFSVSSMVLTAVGSPALAVLASEHMPLQAGMAMAGGAMAVSAFTTSLLYWFTKPYVVNLSVDPASPDVVHLTTLSLLGRPAKSVVHIDEVTRELGRPFASFQVPSTGDHYFVHAGVGDVENWGHVLSKLADMTKDDVDASSAAAKVQSEIDALSRSSETSSVNSDTKSSAK